MGLQLSKFVPDYTELFTSILEHEILPVHMKEGLNLFIAFSAFQRKHVTDVDNHDWNNILVAKHLTPNLS